MMTVFGFVLGVSIGLVVEYAVLRGVERLLRQHDWRYVAVFFIGANVAVFIAAGVGSSLGASWAFVGAMCALALLLIVYTTQGAVTVANERQQR